MSNLRDSSKKSETDGSTSTRPQEGMMGPTNQKVFTLKKSASTFLRRKLTSRKTPTRASTLPTAPSATKTSQGSSASLLLPTNLGENPRKILHEVADYFSQAAAEEVRSICDECSPPSTPTSDSRADSPPGDTSPSTQSSSSRQVPQSYKIVPKNEEVGKNPCELQDQTFPEHTLSRARSQSEPTRQPKSASLSTSFSCSNVDLINSSNSKSRINNSLKTSRTLLNISTSQTSPLSKEIVFQLNGIHLDSSSTSESPKISSGLRRKKSDQKPRLAAQRKNKFDKSNPRGESALKEILHQGIAAHQRNDMILSAILFEQCAKGNGGCGIGMLMWALALRHGWGCPVDTTKAFGWLQLSIETLLRELHQAKIEKQRYDELQNLKNTPKDLLVAQGLISEIKGVTSELLLALYELGQCLMYGWGCQRDKELAVQYYRLAANLGDPDAQKEIAYCYEVGSGVKKSSQNAARYYRMASAQGVQMMGYQWIWKEKVSLNFTHKI